ncbi:MAG: aminoglycoside phosphotransferase, partial [Myxococcota bacterium]
YAERSDRYGPALESDNLDDVARLLGHRPKSWQEADAQLEEFVLKAGPESDPDLVRILHRRLLREEALLEPALRELQNAHMAPID